MKLSEKNVLIGTGIVFVILFAVVKFGHERPIDQQLDVKIASSFYNVNDGKLILQLENPIDQFEEFHITVIDQQDNSSYGTSKQVQDKIIFDTVMPELNFQAPLKVKIEEATTQKEVTVQYKIPESHIGV